MRASFPLTLVASVAVHFCVAIGIVVAHFHESVVPMAAPNTPVATTMLLQPEQLPATQAVKALVEKPVVSSAPVQLAPPALPKIEKAVPAFPLLKTGAEVNPNAHVKALPPEAVLSPTPPPQLNGANGITFVLDISGSMYESFAGSNRLAFARAALADRINAMKDGTPFAIVLYAQRACASGPLVAASNETRNAAVRFIMRDVDCGGGTNLPAGLAAAAQLRTGSIVLMSDGELNMPAYVLCAKTSELLGSTGHRPALTVVGIAPRLKVGADRLLQEVAAQVDGTYAAVQTDGATPLLTADAAAARAPSAQ